MGGQRGQGDPPYQIIRLIIMITAKTKTKEFMITKAGNEITVSDSKVTIIFNNRVVVEVDLTPDEMLDLANALADERERLQPRKQPSWRK